ncbi:metabolite traffic protein EboE [Planotetraspora phitsanulokensis]|uniref:Xylose isomerase n=1 Tax=Planotetraspora phitsanulokensis TaxID=575192 RepID=A0A8J3UDF3_9ACTN|nr:metabolite traffic protein EboE [Planotetraspora phitsanulokensis]GII43453.1 xylose isomerase [Planotetraspora phitsanulokensis]
MRFRHQDGSTVHLAYCTNVHPAEDLDGVITQLRDYAAPVRERLGVARLGVGLWLSRPVADALVADPAQVVRLRDALTGHGLEVVTLNAFPYRSFHDESSSKLRVYRPDWTTPERLHYTLDVARLLAALLPDDVTSGTVSSLPLAWRSPWTPDTAEAARRRIGQLAEGLAVIAASTGRTIRVGFEPEPGCVVETTAQAAEHLSGLDPAYLGVCLDACHLAVQFEEPGEALARLATAGLPVVKLQASCALQADDPADSAVREALLAFDEPRFIHQTRERDQWPGADDLGEALSGDLAGASPWRVHFHVPLHAAPAAPLGSTQDVLDGTLRALLGGPAALTHHVEVETYTWQALPEDRRPRTGGDLVEGIAQELAWARDRLIDLGLKEEIR